jgi:hypothetical protein
MRASWVPIRYSAFWDIPRTFVCQLGGHLYLFDCQFDPAADEYSENYEVYRVPPDKAHLVENATWTELLESHNARVGSIAVAKIGFQGRPFEVANVERAREELDI